jgi:hypothetical protein
MLLEAALAAAVAAAPGLSVDTGKDSVVSDTAPVRVTRPDALTGAPVVIGMSSGSSVNTGSASCWEKGGLGVALTPDIRPGDTVSAGGESVVAGPGPGSGGVAAGCTGSYAWNAVTGSSAASGSGEITFTGVAQPLASGVSVSLTDGARTTASVDGVLGSDGTFSARVPASALAPLNDGDVTVNAVFAVPDVATGALAHVLGAPLTIGKRTGVAGPTVAPPVAIAPPGPPRSVAGLRVPARIGRAHVARSGLRVVFVVPQGARTVRVRLARGRRTAFAELFPASAPGSTQLVRVRARVPRGRYRLTVSALAGRRRVGAAASARVVVR